MNTMRLEKLKKEGVLQGGDSITTPRLGTCEVVTIESVHTITVKNKAGKHFRLSGLSLGASMKMASA